MSDKPFKKSNFIGVTEKTIRNYIRNVDSDLKSIFTFIQRNPRIIRSSAEPTLTKNSAGYWKDTDDSKFYLLLNIDGVQKKIELV